MIRNWKEYTLERINKFFDMAGDLNQFQIEIDANASEDAIPSIKGTFSFNPPRIEIAYDGTPYVNMTSVKDDAVRYEKLDIN